VTVSAISRAVATARAIAERCVVETVERVAVFFRAVVDDAALRFCERVVCASAEFRPKLTRLATARLPIQKFDFLSTFTTRGCKLLEAQGHDSKELLERKRFIVSGRKTLTVTPLTSALSNSYATMSPVQNRVSTLQLRLSAAVRHCGI